MAPQTSTSLLDDNSQDPLLLEGVFILAARGQSRMVLHHNAAS